MVVIESDDKWYILVFFLRAADIDAKDTSYLAKNLNPNIICIRIRPEISNQILFVFEFGQKSET